MDRAIRQAALRLFLENGVEGVGVEQVAEAARVARTTVYRRWSSRESLLAEAIAERRGEAEEAVLRGRLAPMATLDAVVDALSATVSPASYRRMISRLIGSLVEHPRLMEVYRVTHLVPRRRVAAEALEKARAGGLLHAHSDPEMVLDLVAGAVMYRLLIHPQRRSEAGIRPYLLRVLKELGIGGGLAANRRQ